VSTDLFGEEVREPLKNLVKGYAARPGSGPVGETCRSCANAVSHETSRRYWKCALIKPTHGPGTDIRLKSPACAYWRTGQT
jgi:hypothetical protein